MDNSAGFIKLSRKAFSNNLWNQNRTYSDWEAWIDLIQSARFEPNVGIVNVGVASIKLQRGQLAGSIRYLAQRWTWGERKVRVFLAYLRKNDMIETETVSGHTVITLVNYDKYNSSCDDTPKDTPKDTDNTRLLKELADSVTQLRTQLRTQQEIIGNLGHSEDTKNKKEKNNKTFPNGNAKDGDPDGSLALSLMFPSDESNPNPAFIAFAEWVGKNVPYCANPKNWEHGITQQEFERLRDKFGYDSKSIARTLAEIENRKDKRKTYTNLYRTTLNWLKNATR